MTSSKFWALFHKVWGEDSAKELGSEYDKKAWMYVQNKIERYETNKVAKAIRPATNP